MKKIGFSVFVILAVLLLPLGLHAQNVTARGNFLIGSALGFSSNTSTRTQGGSAEEGLESFQWNLAPHVGYFLFDNFNLGIGMDYTFSREKRAGQEDKDDDSDLLFGPFARFYVPFGGDMAVFLEGNFGFGTSSDDIILNGEAQSISTDIIAYGIGPGFTIFSNNNIGLETAFKYNFARSRFNTVVNNVTTETITKTNQFAVSLGIQFYFGGLRRI